MPHRVLFECFWVPGSECPKECFLSACWHFKHAKKHSKSSPWSTLSQVPKSTQKALRGALSGPGAPGHSCKWQPGSQGYFLPLELISRKLPHKILRARFVRAKDYLLLLLSIFDTEYDRAKAAPHNGNDPPPAPGSLKRSLFPPLLNNVENKGTQGVPSEVRRGTSSIHFHCPVPRSSSHIGHGDLGAIQKFGVAPKESGHVRKRLIKSHFLGPLQRNPKVRRPILGEFSGNLVRQLTAHYSGKTCH